MASDPTFFDSAADFRAWLEVHHGHADVLMVGFRKVASGKPSMTWPESGDEALCFGWIDGVRQRIDDASYQIRFTPRRSRSIWSQVNVAKVEQLMAQGRMRPAGMAAYEARSLKKTGVYAYEQERAIELDAQEIRAFKKAKVAWTYFQACPPSYRKVITYWVVSARQATTRARRLAALVQACGEQRRLLK